MTTSESKERVQVRTTRRIKSNAEVIAALEGEIASLQHKVAECDCPKRTARLKAAIVNRTEMLEKCQT